MFSDVLCGLSHRMALTPGKGYCVSGHDGERRHQLHPVCQRGQTTSYPMYGDTDRQEDDRSQIDNLANASKRIYFQNGCTDGNRDAKRK